LRRVHVILSFFNRIQLVAALSAVIETQELHWMGPQLLPRDADKISVDLNPQ
jgi:hypothetical protein